MEKQGHEVISLQRGEVGGKRKRKDGELEEGKELHLC